MCTSNRIYKKNSIYKHEISLPVLQDTTNEQPTNTLQKYKIKARTCKNVPERPRHKPKPKAPARPPPPKMEATRDYRELSPEHLPLHPLNDVGYLPAGREYMDGPCTQQENSGGAFESVSLHPYEECSHQNGVANMAEYMNDNKDCEYYNEIPKYHKPDENYENTRFIIDNVESKGSGEEVARTRSQRPPSVIRPPRQKDRPVSGLKPFVNR